MLYNDMSLPRLNFMRMTRQSMYWSHAMARLSRGDSGVYTSDNRPAGETNAPAVWFRYSPGPIGIHPKTHLKDYSGILQADAYAG